MRCLDHFHIAIYRLKAHSSTAKAVVFCLRPHKDNELFLRDVAVLNNEDGRELYQVPGLYISRNPEEITIEFPGLNFIYLGAKSDTAGQKEMDS